MSITLEKIKELDKESITKRIEITGNQVRRFCDDLAKIKENEGQHHPIIYKAMIDSHKSQIEELTS
jgi:hypothetical protein